MEVGEYSYASAHAPPTDWAQCLAPYLYEFSPEKLVIGKFCQIADGVQFITASANHRYDGISTYPFAIFGGAGTAERPSMPTGGPDTLVGHDVWFGAGARVLPGTTIGNGVIVGAGAVVSGTVPDYSIVVGNPARITKQRFSDEEVVRLNAVAWWNWPISKILEHEAEIAQADVVALEQVSLL